MDNPIFIAIITLIFSICVAFLVRVLMRNSMRKKKSQPGYPILFWVPQLDYSILFWLGIVLLPIYLIGESFIEGPWPLGCLTLSAIYIIIGLTNKDKWGSRQPLTAKERKVFTGLMFAGILGVLFGLVIFLLKVLKIKQF